MTMIVINDEDGHCHVFVFNQENVRDLLKMVIKSNKSNTCLDDPEKAQSILDKDDIVEMSEYLDQEITGRSRGGRVYFVPSGSQMWIRPRQSNQPQSKTKKIDHHHCK